ncbi:MAG: hypothetical protein HYT49_00040 [Candidatus Wildermuthbacteria bacterium]|nr:hypothetical protein [Candidatus Wildermuthbacteria bacterium]
MLELVPESNRKEERMDITLSFDIERKFGIGKFRTTVRLRSGDMGDEETITKAVLDLVGLDSFHLLLGRSSTKIDVNTEVYPEPHGSGIMIAGSNAEIVEEVTQNLIQSFMGVAAWLSGTGTLQVTASEFHPSVPIGTVIIPAQPD